MVCLRTTKRQGVPGSRTWGEKEKSHSPKPESIPERLNWKQRVDMYSLSMHLPRYVAARASHIVEGKFAEPRLPGSCISEGRASYFPFQALDLPRRERQTSGHSCRAE